MDISGANTGGMNTQVVIMRIAAFFCFCMSVSFCNGAFWSVLSKMDAQIVIMRIAACFFLSVCLFP